MRVCALVVARDPQTPQTTNLNKKLSRYENIRDLIHIADLFPAPSTDQGWYYDKQEEYLAIALVENRKTQEEVEQAISILKNCESFILSIRHSFIHN